MARTLPSRLLFITYPRSLCCFLRLLNVLFSIAPLNACSHQLATTSLGDMTSFSAMSHEKVQLFVGDVNAKGLALETAGYKVMRRWSTAVSSDGDAEAEVVIGHAMVPVGGKVWDFVGVLSPQETSGAASTPAATPATTPAASDGDAAAAASASGGSGYDLTTDPAAAANPPAANPPASSDNAPAAAPAPSPPASDDATPAATTSSASTAAATLAAAKEHATSLGFSAWTKDECPAAHSLGVGKHALNTLTTAVASAFNSSTTAGSAAASWISVSVATSNVDGPGITTALTHMSEITGATVATTHQDDTCAVKEASWLNQWENAFGGNQGEHVYLKYVHNKAHQIIGTAPPSSSAAASSSSSSSPSSSSTAPAPAPVPAPDAAPGAAPDAASTSTAAAAAAPDAAAAPPAGTSSLSGTAALTIGDYEAYVSSVHERYMSVPEKDGDNAKRWRSWDHWLDSHVGVK